MDGCRTNGAVFHYQCDGPASMTSEDAWQISDELCKEARSAYIAMTILSMFACIVLLGTSDRDLFSIFRQVEIPFIGAQISVNTFFWMIPFIISVLLLYMNLLISRVVQVSNVNDGKTIYRIYARAPMYARWAIGEAANPINLSAIDRVSSLLLAYALPVIIILYIWWRSHIFHDAVVSSASMFSLIVIFISHWLVLREVNKNGAASIYSSAFVGLMISVISIMFFVNLLRTQFERNPMFTRVDLSLAEISPRPDGYVPRFTYAASFMREHLPENGDAHEQNDYRFSLEKEWFNIRSSYLKEFGRSDLDRVDLRGANMSEAFLVGVRIRQGSFDRAWLYNADMEAIDATGSSFVSAQLEGAHLEQAYLEGANFSDANMDRAYLEESTVKCTIFAGADLTQAKFDGAFIDRGDFRGAILKHASFRGSYAKRTNFSGADVAGADFHNTILWGSDLTDVKNLAPGQLNAALGDAETKLPAGYAIPKCWENVPTQDMPYRYQWWLEVEDIKDRLTCRKLDIPLSPSEACGK